MANIKMGADTQEDGAIQATNIRGLNTIASPYTLPYGATPDCCNVQYDSGGGVSSRPGTGYLGQLETSATTPTQVEPHTYSTELGYQYVIVPQNDDLLIYDNRWDGSHAEVGLKSTAARLYSGMQKSGVFKTAPKQTSYVELGHGRVLILTGTNTPIELRFDEYTTTLSGSTVDPTITTSSLPGWHHCQGARTKSGAVGTLASQCYVYVNGTEVLLGTKTSANIDTLTVVGTYPAGTKIDVVRIIWGFWSEAKVWFGDRFFGTTQRFRASDANRTVAIPEKLRDGLRFYQNSTNYGTQLAVGYGTVLSVAGKHGYFTYGNGATSADYWLSSGSGTTGQEYNENSNGTVLGTGITSITFKALHIAGAYNENASNSTVLTTFSRVRDLGFTAGSRTATQTSGASTAASTLLVRKRWGTNDDVSLTQDVEGLSSTLNYSGFALEIPTFDPVIRRTSVTTFNAIGFYELPTGTSGSIAVRRGVQPDSQIFAINLTNNYVGIGGYLSRTQYNEDGFVIPVFGMSEFCDQGRGLFPNCGSLFENRLWLGGVPTAPLTLFASAPFDTYVAGLEYLYFQADPYNDPETAPLDIGLQNTSQSDFIVRMAAMYGSLFLFSRDGVWRMQPTLYTQLCSSFGVCSLRAACAGDGRVFFASSDGVFELVQSQGLSDSYVPEEISATIRNQFEWFKPDQLVFDEVNNRLFVFDTENNIFVYYAETGGWARWEFALPQFLILRGAGHIRCRDGSQHFTYWFSTKVGSYVDYYCMAQLPYPAVVDFSGVPAALILNWMGENEMIGGYKRLYENTQAQTNITMFMESRSPRIPIRTQAQDHLYTGGTASTLGIERTFEVGGQDNGEWYYPGKDIARLYRTTTGTLEYYRMLHRFPQQVYGSFREWEAYYDDDDIAQFRYGDLVSSSTLAYNTLAGSLDNEQIGYAYPSYWSSGKFTLGQLTQYKRVTHLALTFDNSFINPTREFYEPRPSTARTLILGEQTGRHLINCHLVSEFEDGYTDIPFEDIYNVDNSFQGTDDNRFSSQAVFRVPIQGVGYDFSFSVFNYAPEAWRMTGFQIDGKMKGKRYGGK